MIGISGRIPSRILRVAADVRKWALAENFGYPNGMCGEASIKLVGQLQEIGISADFKEGEVYLGGTLFGEHCWVEIDGRILDVTADQFNHKRLFGPIVWASAYRLRGIYLINCTLETI